jgi:hypothetical protein
MLLKFLYTNLYIDLYIILSLLAYGQFEVCYIPTVVGNQCLALSVSPTGITDIHLYQSLKCRSIQRTTLQCAIDQSFKLCNITSE